MYHLRNSIAPRAGHYSGGYSWSNLAIGENQSSTYGADAYAFANNEPITLLNGAELLGLLRKHGYSFRINLQEARRGA
jgi:hypothetical protein